MKVVARDSTRAVSMAELKTTRGNPPSTFPYTPLSGVDSAISIVSVTNISIKLMELFTYDIVPLIRDDS